MVAYSFKRQFCQQIELGTKTQTIRAHRKRHALVGERIQLYFGMRTKSCRKLLSQDPVCVSVDNISIAVPESGVGQIINQDSSEVISDAFAIADGFSNAKEMTDFWRVVHGCGQFNGVLIKWERT